MENRKQFDGLARQELVDSLKPLGIREIGERMEVSPLLVGQSEMIQGQDFVCCTCKIGPDILDDDTLPSFFTVGDEEGITDGIGDYLT